MKKTPTTEGFCLYSSLEGYVTTMEVHHELPREVRSIIVNQRVWNQWRDNAPWKTIVHQPMLDCCLADVSIGPTFLACLPTSSQGTPLTRICAESLYRASQRRMQAEGLCGPPRFFLHWLQTLLFRSVRGSPLWRFSFMSSLISYSFNWPVCSFHWSIYFADRAFRTQVI